MLLHEEEDEEEDEEDEESVKIIFTCTSYLIRHFHPIFLHAVTFLHVLYFDVLRRQIEIETERMPDHPIPWQSPQYYPV